MDANLRIQIIHYWEFSIDHVNTNFFASLMFMNILDNKFKYHDGK
jgi:hypothetical protein